MLEYGPSLRTSIIPGYDFYNLVMSQNPVSSLNHCLVPGKKLTQLATHRLQEKLKIFCKSKLTSNEHSVVKPIRIF